MSNDFRAEIDVSVKGVDSIASAQKATDDLHKSLLQAAESADALGKGLSGTAKGAKDISKSAGQVTSSLSQTGEAARGAGDKAKKAGEDMATSWKSQTNSLSNTRYALYDVAAMYGSVGIAATAVAGATAGVAASYEKSFANVARTTMATGEELGNIRNELIALSQVTPVSYDDITAVASLGAQLGIANDNLSDFTSTVTMFAASTDVTVERTAMGLGRIAQLTGTAGSEIDNLADSIYYTGINAVATEGQILSVAEQIATAGNLSGMANHEVIALASALASLGVAPEAARGSIMRVFANIEKAATEGGESLEKFAQISGTSADHIAQNWGTNTQQVFTEFIEGLGRLSDAGQSTNAILSDVGIYQVRDVKALQLLLNNMGVYLTAQEDTAKAYKENSALSEGFAIQTDTLVDAIARLKNNLAAIASEGSGFTNVLKGAINVLNNILQVVNQFAQNPIGKIFIGSTAAIATAVAAWASFHVAVNLARGGLAAYATAQAGLMKSNIKLKIGLVQVTRELFALATGGEAATRRLLDTGSAMDKTAASAGRASASTSLLGKSISVIGKGNAIMIGITAAVAGATWAMDRYAESQKTATDKARDFYGDLSGLAEAIAKDTEAGDDSMGNFAVTLDEASKSSYGLATELEVAADGTLTLKNASDDVSKSLETQIALMGELTQQALAQKIVDTVGEPWSEFGSTLRSVGFDIDEYMAKAMKMDGSAEKYAAGFEISKRAIEEMGLAAMAAFSDAQNELYELEKSGTTSGPVFDDLTAKLAAAQDARDKFFDSDVSNMEKSNEAVRAFVKAASMVNPALEGAANDALLLAAGAKAAGTDIKQAGYDTEETTEKLDAFTRSVQDFLSTADAEIGIANALFDLGESLYKNGVEFDLFSQNGIANMEALRNTVNTLATASAGDADVFVSSVFGMLSALEQQGVVVGEELNWVYDMLNQVAGSQYGVDFSTRAARQNIADFMADLIAMQQQANAAMRQQIANTDWSDKAIGAGRALSQRLADGEASLEKMLSSQKRLATATDTTAKHANNLSTGYRNAAANAKNTGGGAKKAADSTKKAADEAKRLKQEMRTSSDYARDLAGVFSDINDLVFGLGEAQQNVADNFKSMFEEFTKSAGDIQLNLFAFDRGAARDQISQAFIDLKQAAADAQKEVRDAVVAVQDAHSKIQGLSAEGDTLEYQLSVARALGSAERIAEIEAKIAQNKADQAEAANDLADAAERQRKAQEALGRGTSGGSGQDIKNRSDLRDLAKGYMEYADTLRAAGVSEKEIAKYAKQAEKDFISQGKALGFTDAQLKVFSDGIAATGKGIESNSTALKGNQKALNDLYRSHVDAVTAFAATGASQKQVADFAKQSEKQFMSQAKQLGYNVRELGQYRLAWDGLLKTINALPSQVTIRSNVQNPSAAPLQKFFTDWNNKQLSMKASVNSRDADNWRKANTGGRGMSAPFNIPVRATTNTADFAKAARGMKLLMELQRDYANIQSYMRNPVGNFSKIASTVANAAVRVSKLTSGSFAMGGFTGRGGKLDEAGIVHRGEYVFRKDQVDQNTGTPKPEALISMLGKSMGFSMGNQQPTVPGYYMNQQPVRQDNAPFYRVELLPNQMVQLAQLMGQYAPRPNSMADTALGVNKINEARTGRGQG